MKYVVLLLLFPLLQSTFAQCDYSLITIDKKQNKLHLESLPILLDMYETAFNGRIIEAKLIREQNRYTIEIGITQDSYAQKLKPICFEKGTKLSFSFTNNKIITLIQTEEEICGVRRRGKNNYNAVSSYARFILTPEAYDILVKEEIVMMKIISKNYTRKFVLKSELEVMNKEEVIVTHPNRFFVENIKCLTEPQFEKS